MIGIIIVNYNDWDNLRKCIKSISLQLPYKIYVVDCASKESPYIVELQKTENITYIQSSINGGYSFGNNLGLKKAIKDGCKYFIISNTDIVFEKNSIQNLIIPLQNKDCDIVGPNVILSSGEKQEEILGVRVTPISKLKLIINSGTKGVLFSKFKARFSNLNNNGLLKYAVYGISGCCFAFNKSASEKVFPYDENIFLYNEEWMLAERAYREGLRTIINKDSTVFHLHGATTTKQLKLFSYRCFVESEFYVLKTLFPRFLILNFVIFFCRLPKYIYIYIKERLINFV